MLPERKKMIGNSPPKGWNSLKFHQIINSPFFHQYSPILNGQYLSISILMGSYPCKSTYIRQYAPISTNIHIHPHISTYIHQYAPIFNAYWPFLSPVASPATSHRLPLPASKFGAGNEGRRHEEVLHLGERCVTPARPARCKSVCVYIYTWEIPSTNGWFAGSPILGNAHIYIYICIHTWFKLVQTHLSR